MDKNMLDTPLKNVSEYSEFVKKSNQVVDNTEERDILLYTAREGYVEAIKSRGEAYYIEREMDILRYRFDFNYKTGWLDGVFFVIFRILIIIGAIIGEALGVCWFGNISEDSPLIFVIFVLTFLLIPGLVYFLWNNVDKSNIADICSSICSFIGLLFWKIYQKSSKYLADCDKAKQKGINEYKLDLERALREQEEAKRKLEQLRINKYLYNEWMDKVKALRSDALRYDFYVFTKENSDSELIKIMLDKMPYELTTPRILMEKARIKATNDWIEIRTSISNINDIFDD